MFVLTRERDKPTWNGRKSKVKSNGATILDSVYNSISYTIDYTKGNLVSDKTYHLHDENKIPVGVEIETNGPLLMTSFGHTIFYGANIISNGGKIEALDTMSCVHILPAHNIIIHDQWSKKHYLWKKSELFSGSR